MHATAAVARKYELAAADGYVVVSTWHYKDKPGQYVYDHYTTLNDALDGYREFEDGEWAHARAVGIFEAKHGLPIGGRMEPARIMQLMHETRSA